MDCVPGSGKTTTILHIARAYPNKKILVLTYNSKLRHESREKINQKKIENTIIHTYHSYYHNHYAGNCYTDKMLEDILKNNFLSFRKTSFDFLILDEAQDITPLYYSAICNIVKQNKKVIRMAIFGDRKQSIFTYNGADSRFLEKAISLFHFKKFNKSKWKIINMDITFRLNDIIASFVNNCIIDNEKSAIKLNAKDKNRDGSCVKYIKCNTFEKTMDNLVFIEIFTLLKSDLAKPEDIFVIAPSLKGSITPIKILANLLSNNEVPIYFPGESSNESVDEKVIKGKICFSSFHQVKGLERKIVVVYNFDNSYFEFFAKNEASNICPNTLYVALTRAKSQLFLVHNISFEYLPFLNLRALKDNCTVIGKVEIKKKNILPTKRIIVTPDNLVSHLRSSVLENIRKKISVIEIKKKYFIDIKSTFTNENGNTENVGALNSIAIPACVEYLRTGETYIERGNKIKTIEAHVFLKLATKYYCEKNCIYHMMKQLTSYNWIKKKDFDECVKKILENISKDGIFNIEFQISGFEYERILCGKTLNCKIDVIDNETAWIFSFGEIKTETIVKILCIMYGTKIKKIDKSVLRNGMKIKYRDGNKISTGKINSFADTRVWLTDEQAKEKKIILFHQIIDFFSTIKKFCIFNPLNGSCVTLLNNMSVEFLEKIVNGIIVEKYINEKKNIIDDEIFISKMKLIKFKYFYH